MQDHYILKAGPSSSQYTFVSQGTHRSIIKFIQFTQYENQDFYNLGFGDQDQHGNIDDLVISNNGDVQKFWQQ